jgi:hypothetical protein
MKLTRQVTLFSNSQCVNVGTKKKNLVYSRLRTAASSSLHDDIIYKPILNEIYAALYIEVSLNMGTILAIK